jgi:hypothetical protein
MKSALLALAALACASAGLWACNPCERDHSADGLYPVVTDCAGTGLIRGTIEVSSFGLDSVGSPLETSACDADADAGVHLAVTPGDAGLVESAPSSSCTATAATQSGCADAWAAGASRLGLPERVRATGNHGFELYGDVLGVPLDCASTQFGDETLLLCRASGRIVCTAVINPRS